MKYKKNFKKKSFSKRRGGKKRRGAKSLKTYRMSRGGIKL